MSGTGSKYAASSLHNNVAKALFDSEVDLYRQQTRWARQFHKNGLSETTEAAADRAGDPRAYSREPLEAGLIDDAVFWAGEVPETELALVFLRYFSWQYGFELPADISEVYDRVRGT